MKCFLHPDREATVKGYCKSCHGAIIRAAQKAASKAHELAYFVEVDQNGCSQCGAGRTWTVIGPDGCAQSVSFGGEDGQEEAIHLAEILNEAYEAGRASK